MTWLNDGGAAGLRFALFAATFCLLLAHVSGQGGNFRSSPTEKPPVCPAKNDIPDDSKFDCLPGFNLTITQDECTGRGCCWQEVPNQNKSGPYEPDYNSDRFPIHVGVPSCYYPDAFPNSYELINSTATSYGLVTFLNLSVPSAYPRDVQLLRVDVYFETQTRLRVKITDAENDRYEVPVPQLPTIDTAATITDYTFKVTDKGARFSVVRKSTNEVIFDASVGSFIYSDRFLQLSAALPSTNLFGLGQHNDNFRRSFDWQLIPLFASLFYPDYGSHPFYLAMEKSHQSHGVFLFNSNAMDILLQPTPAITYRAVGGILDFYFFLGPTPENVIQQYTTLIGKPVLPPYWTLGFHICKYNYLSDENTREVWARTVAAGIPFDVQWNDIDYMDNYKIFTYNKDTYGGLPKLIDDIHAKNMRYVPIIDSGVHFATAEEKYETFDEGVRLDIFVKDSNGTGLASGRVWPEHAVFPDWTHPSSQQFWTDGYQRMYNDIKYDGAWIDMDEPSTFSAGDYLGGGCPDDEILPYTPAVEGGALYAHTVCMSSKHYGGSHFDLHSLYGFMEAIKTNQAMKDILNKRPFVMSRSTFPGHGHYGTHWTGDVYSKWHDLKQSIPAILNFNLYGIPMVGSDICGFRGNTSLEMCQRWTALGAFYPFARNHNENITIDQDPVALGPEMVATAKKNLFLRYNLLPFMYTQFYRAHLLGGTVVRPLFFEFPEDEKTYGLDEQFMWGEDLLVIPVLKENANTVITYLPKGFWYMYPGMNLIDSKGQTFELKVPVTDIALAIRGGSVIVTQDAMVTTFESRRNNFSLIVALDEHLEAVGELYWDDGDSIDPVENNVFTQIKFTVGENAVVSSVPSFNYEGDVPMILDNIVVLGVSPQPVKVLVNNKDHPFEYISQNLVVSNAQIKLKDSFTVSWQDAPPTTTTKKPNSSAMLFPLSKFIMFTISTILSIICLT